MKRRARISLPTTLLLIGIFAASFLFLSKAHAAFEISDGSVRALYHLEDVTDSTGNHNFTTSTDITFTSGLLGKAATCNGTSSILDQGSSTISGSRFGTGAGIAFWAKPSSQPMPGERRFMVNQEKEVAAPDPVIRIFLWVEYDNENGVNKVVFARNVAAVQTDTVSASTTLPTTSFTHFAFNFYPSTSTTSIIEGFINGVSIGTSTAVGDEGFGGFASNGVEACAYRDIGNPAFFFAGQVDELVLSDHPFSAQTITALYNGGAGQEICVTAGCGTPVVDIASGTLQQFKSDAVTPIAEGGTTTEDTVIFAGIPMSSSTDNLRIQIELQPSAVNFTGIPNLTTAVATSGTMVGVATSSLGDGGYHWQARAFDTVTGATSTWQNFSNPPQNPDFIVSLPIGTKAAHLAKLVINDPYLGNGTTWGGKGWDPRNSQLRYVMPSEIGSGYYFYNNDVNVKAVQFGSGLDCSGLIEWAFNYAFDPNKGLDTNVIRYPGANAEYHQNSTTTNEGSLMPGDLLFFGTTSTIGITTSTHVAMYVGSNGIFDVVEARSPEKGIIASLKSEREQAPNFLGASSGFRRITLAPDIAGSVQVSSPIDLAVTDPDGFTITSSTFIQTDEEYLREVPGQLYYSERVMGSDGFPEDRVYWPTQKTGDYTVIVSPKPEAPATSTYGLTFQSGSMTISLAQNVPISQIPNQGYGVNVSSTGVISPFTPVTIDIRPGTYPNNVNLGSNGVVPVAIFGSATFDVHDINATSTTLANASIKLKGNGQPQATYSDVNGDGFTDITMNFLIDALQIASSDTKATLDGFLTNGAEFKGSDSVRVVP